VRSTPALAGSRIEPAPARTLIAGVGYANLRDGSVGPVLAARLQAREWPAGVEVEDFSFGAIDAVHRLRDGAYERAVFFGAHQRGDSPGTVRRYLTPADPVRFDTAIGQPRQNLDYVMVSSGDAVDRAFVGLYAHAADWAVLDKEWPNSGWRLYRVTRG